MVDLLDREDAWEFATCGHEWPRALVVVDANGHPLAGGDAVTLIKDLKVKGSSRTIKARARGAGSRVVASVQGSDHAMDANTLERMGVMISSTWVVEGLTGTLP